MTEAQIAARRGATLLDVEVSGSGNPLVYLHGLGGFGALTRNEAPSGYRVGVFDQPRTRLGQSDLHVGRVRD
jgi:hypothetical protein